MLPDALEARARVDTLRCTRTRDRTPEPPYGKIEIHAEIAPEVTPLHVTDARAYSPGQHVTDAHRDPMALPEPAR